MKQLEKYELLGMIGSGCIGKGVSKGRCCVWGSAQKNPIKSSFKTNWKGGKPTEQGVLNSTDD